MNLKILTNKWKLNTGIQQSNVFRLLQKTAYNPKILQAAILSKNCWKTFSETQVLRKYSLKYLCLNEISELLGLNKGMYARQEKEVKHWSLKNH